MLMERFDPFLAEFDRLTQRSFGTSDGVGVPMDVVRRGDDLVVRMDLPGVSADHIELTVENHVLTISAERRPSYADGDKILVQERFEGHVTRRVRVPEWVDADAVSASYVDGVLTVTLPLAEKAKPRRINVTAAAEQTQLNG
jgi:HSP20 family protein